MYITVSGNLHGDALYVYVQVVPVQYNTVALCSGRNSVEPILVNDGLNKPFLVNN